jgi:Protein of unknown function (DUF2939)
MSKIIVDLSDQKASVPQFGEYRQPKKRSLVKKVLLFLVGFLFISLIIGLIGGYFYWQSIKSSPQYSLALLVEAARNDDNAQIAQLVDTEAVMDSFVPQISDKAIELYGRNLPKDLVSKALQIGLPAVKPKIKEIAAKELPKLIREKTKQAEKVPYWLIALGASTALDIKIDGETAIITSKIPDKPLELTMKKNGDKWKVVGIKDENLATKIAQSIGQKLLKLANENGIESIGKQLGLENLGDILKQF